MALMHLHCERDIVEDRDVRKNRADLERAREPQMGAAIDGQCRDVAPLEEHAPAIRRDTAGQLADERCLACAVWTNQCMNLATFNLKIHCIGGA
jgi:hypothetical protein